MSAAPAPVTVRAIVAGAFGVLRAQPVAVLVWALIYGAATAAFTFAVRAGLRIQGDPMPRGNSDPLPPMGASLLVSLLYLTLFVTLLTAAMRSVFRPSEPGLAFLRFGMAELRQIGLMLFYLILFYVGLIIVGIVLAVIAGLLIAAVGIGMAIFGIVGVGIAILLALAAWLSVRLSLPFR